MVTDKELLNHSIKKSIKNILSTVKEFDKNSKDCLLCQKEFKIHNIHDLVRVYSLLMHCITYHCTTVGKLKEEDLFVVELFLLKFIMKPEPSDIRTIILFRNNTNERLYRESLSLQLVALFQTHYLDKKIAFNCEQDIESLLYKYYKRLEELKQTEVVDKPEYLLLILYVRKEYDRFQRLYGRVKKDNFMYKLGLLMNIFDENTSEVDKLCGEYDVYVENRIFESKDKSIFEVFLRYIDKKYKLDLEDVVDLFEKSPSIKLWVSDKTSQHQWEESVRMWARNRSSSSNYVDNSMIDLCIKHVKYEDGWLIYINSYGANTSGFSRAIRLCCVALRTSKNSKWRNRLFEVISDVFENIKSVNLIVLLENLFSDIEKLTLSSYMKIISDLQGRLLSVKLNDEAIDTILRFYYNVSTNNTEIARKVCKYAMDFYSKWIKSKKQFCFFIKKSEYDTRIYSSLLGICDNAKDCEQFYRVCRAILRNETSINREMCRRLESFHTRNCKNCIYKHRQVISVSESRGFISHLFE